MENKQINWTNKTALIQAQTDANNHTTAVYLLAQILENQIAQEEIRAIAKIADGRGYMPLELGMFRDSIRQDLLNRVKEKYPEHYNEVRLAF